MRSIDNYNIKNYRAVHIPDTLGGVWFVLKTQSVVYYVPLGRVMSTKFFLKEIWTTERLNDAARNGEFVQIEPTQNVNDIKR